MNCETPVSTVHTSEGVTRDKVLIVYFDSFNSNINKNVQYMSTAITRGRLRNDLIVISDNQFPKNINVTDLIVQKRGA